jgi:hypothetical protein
MLRDVQKSGPKAVEETVTQKPRNKRVAGVRRLIRNTVLAGAAGLAGLTALGMRQESESSEKETQASTSMIGKLRRDFSLYIRYQFGDLRLNPQEDARYRAIDAATAAGLNKPQRTPNFNAFAEESGKKDLAAATRKNVNAPQEEIYVDIGKD